MEDSAIKFEELGKTAHVLFEEQARKTPEAVALIDGDVSVTYQALNEITNGLCEKIKATECQGRPIGIFSPRNWNYAAAMIGSMKANAGYMPLGKEAAEKFFFFFF
jgi:non-ribosomal peptide synthetase component F